jgi:hypothetical protein
MYLQEVSHHVYRVARPDPPSFSPPGLLGAYPQIEAAIKEAMVAYATFTKESNARRALLIKGFKQVGACLKSNGELNAATEGIISCIAPRHFMTEADLWRQVATYLKVSGTSPSVITQEVHRVLHAKTQEVKKSRALVKAREVLLGAVDQHPEYRDLLIEGDEKKIRSEAEEILRQKYIGEEYPEGEEVDNASCCDNCSTWTVGEKYCTCGETRLCLDFYGSFLEGDGGASPSRY